MKLSPRHLRLLAALKKGPKKWSGLEKEVGSRLSTRHLWEGLRELEDGGYIKTETIKEVSGSRKKFYRLNPEYEKEVSEQLQFADLEDPFAKFQPLIDQVLQAQLSTEEKLAALEELADYWQVQLMDHFAKGVVHLALVSSLYGDENTSRKLRTMASRDYATAFGNLLDAAFKNKLVALGFAMRGQESDEEPGDFLDTPYPGSGRFFEMAKPPRIPSYKTLMKRVRWPVDPAGAMIPEDDKMRLALKKKRAKMILEKAGVQFGPADFR